MWHEGSFTMKSYLSTLFSTIVQSLEEVLASNYIWSRSGLRLSLSKLFVLNHILLILFLLESRARIRFIGLCLFPRSEFSDFKMGTVYLRGARFFDNILLFAHWIAGFLSCRSLCNSLVQFVRALEWRWVSQQLTTILHHWPKNSAFNGIWFCWHWNTYTCEGRIESVIDPIISSSRLHEGTRSEFGVADCCWLLEVFGDVIKRSCWTEFVRLRNLLWFLLARRLHWLFNFQVRIILAF